MGTTGNVTEPLRSLIHCCTPTQAVQVIPILSPANYLGRNGGVETLWSELRIDSRDACLNIFTLLNPPPQQWKLERTGGSGVDQRKKRGEDEAGTFLFISPKAVPTKGPPLGSHHEAPASPAGWKRVGSRRMRREWDWGRKNGGMKRVGLNDRVFILKRSAEGDDADGKSLPLTPPLLSNPSSHRHLFAEEPQRNAKVLAMIRLIFTSEMWNLLRNQLPSKWKKKEKNADQLQTGAGLKPAVMMELLIKTKLCFLLTITDGPNKKDQKRPESHEPSPWQPPPNI